MNTVGSVENALHTDILGTGITPVEVLVVAGAVALGVFVLRKAFAGVFSKN